MSNSRILLSLFQAVFLPAGYPESVSDDYTAYQIWDTIQAFASAITSSFATQSVLKGYGVGDQQASLVAATVTWLMRDGLGKLGRILFAWYQGTYLDCDCKKWRFFADILYDLSIFLQILASVYKPAFFLLICTSGVVVAIVGVAGGATRAALTQHQARRNNLADVSAKDGSQETMVNMMGLLVSIVLAPLVSENMNLTWVIFALLTAVHLYANWRSMKALNMETLNQARLHLIAQAYFSSGGGHIMSIFDANQKEPVFGRLKRTLKINLGYSLGKVVRSNTELNMLSRLYSGGNYLLVIAPKKRQIYIILNEEATVVDELEAMLQAELLEYCFSSLYGFISLDSLQLKPLMEAISRGDEHAMLTHSRKVTSSMFPAFLASLKGAGWTTTHALLNADEWRARWMMNKPV